MLIEALVKPSKSKIDETWNNDATEINFIILNILRWTSIYGISLLFEKEKVDTSK